MTAVNWKRLDEILRDPACDGMEFLDRREVEAVLRALASRCESEAIEAAGDIQGAENLDEADYITGRRDAFNTVERWINEMMPESGTEQ